MNRQRIIGIVLCAVFMVFLYGSVVRQTMAYTALTQSITATGMNQGDLVVLLQNIADRVNELATDHDTDQVALDRAIVNLNLLRLDFIAYTSGSAVAAATSYTSGGALAESTALTLSAP